MSDNLAYLKQARAVEFELHEQCRSFVNELTRTTGQNGQGERKMIPSLNLVEVVQILRDFFPEKDGMWFMQCLNYMDASSTQELCMRAKRYKDTREARTAIEDSLADEHPNRPEYIADRILWLSSLALDGRVAEWDSWLNDLIEASSHLKLVLKDH